MTTTATVTKKEKSEVKVISEEKLAFEQDILDLFLKFAKKLDKNVILQSFSKESREKILPVFDYEKDILFLVPTFYDDSGTNKFGLRGLRSTWDNILGGQDNLYGVKIEEVYLAVATKSRIGFVTNFLVDDIDKQAKIDILGKFLTECIKKYDMMPETVDPNKQLAENFVYWLSTNRKMLEKKYKEKIYSLQDDSAAHVKALVRNDRETADIKVVLDTLPKRFEKNKKFNNLETIKKLFKHLVPKKYKSFCFESEAIVGLTNDIYVESAGKKYKIGQFEVIVYLSGEIRMNNLTDRKQDSDHPHVLEGRPCLGTVRETVRTLFNDFNFLPLFDLLHTFLCSYINDGDFKPYRIVEQEWGDPDEDWCSDCSQPSAACSCESDRNENICPACNRDGADCACDRCPASGDLMRDTDCEDCDSENEDGSCGY